MSEHIHRWNIEPTDFGARICRGEHDRSSQCEWEYLYWSDLYLEKARRIEELENRPHDEVLLHDMELMQKRIEELEKDRDEWKVAADTYGEAVKDVKELEWKAKVFDAMCEVGLIQFDPSIENHCYSVWGFGAWHHDQDIFKAIADAMEPPTLLVKKS